VAWYHNPSAVRAAVAPNHRVWARGAELPLPATTGEAAVTQDGTGAAAAEHTTSMGAAPASAATDTAVNVVVDSATLAPISLRCTAALIDGLLLLAISALAYFTG
jgi:hypothetical protein